MVRLATAALAAFVFAAGPAAAQVTYAPELYVPRAVTIVGPATLVVPVAPYGAHILTVRRRVLVARTHYVRRTVLVPRTRYVRRVLDVPVTTYRTRRGVVAYPVAGFVTTYPGTGLVGPTWVPPGTSYACQLGTVGCDSSVVGEMAF